MPDQSVHNFYIPVLGIGYSVDTPLKVAKYGITSVMSIIDDTLLEKLRKHYLHKNKMPYEPITTRDEDARAKRVTAYLNLINQMVKKQFTELKSSGFSEGSSLNRYFELLPDFSQLKMKYYEMVKSTDINFKTKLQSWLRNNIKPGSIDVNIMTKVDKTNYSFNGDPLPSEYNDAHSALRGFANSDLESSIILSAGINPRLYSYMEKFREFYPSLNGYFKKKIILKVSDFRSALIQGKFLAKKGLWVSEYRIESALNCGGHAFINDGFLLGPILEEFRKRRNELFNTLREIYFNALGKKNIKTDYGNLKFGVTVQGGVGKYSEQEFLRRYYEVDSVGWGSPFLLVPEVMNVDNHTMNKLSAAGENDLYLSSVSPLGVPFNNLRDNEKDVEKMQKVKDGKPGSLCIKKFLSLNNDFPGKPLCTASSNYIKKKTKELNKNILGESEYNEKFDETVNKSCLCEGLTASALTVNQIDIGKQSPASSVCPGPNIAYFSQIVNLKEMVDHIYGRVNLITDNNRPNMFIKELKLYVDYFQKKMEEKIVPGVSITDAFLNTFYENLTEGINYYKSTLPEIFEEAENVRKKIAEDLETLEEKLLTLYHGMAV
ncbi:MAG: hypothetical protein PVH88_25635 [Ignavibacteria bacterium]|jgi:hypothetical protein